MQKKLKKFLSLLLATVMITTLTAPSALAYEKTLSQNQVNTHLYTLQRFRYNFRIAYG